MTPIVSGFLFGLFVLLVMVPKHVLVRCWRERVLGVVYSLPVPEGFWEVHSAYLLSNGCVAVGTRTGMMYYRAQDVIVHVDGELRSGVVEAISLLDRGRYERGFWKDVDEESHRGKVRVFVRSGASSVERYGMRLIGS
jgi:hypothetical protein